MKNEICDLEADLFKLAKIRESQPKRWERNRENYERWRIRLEERVAELRAEMETVK